MKQVSPSKKKESNTRNEQIKTSFFLLIEAANIIIIAITLFIISCGFVVYRSNTLGTSQVFYCKRFTVEIWSAVLVVCGHIPDGQEIANKVHREGKISPSFTHARTR
jgi:hypothetical protein